MEVAPCPQLSLQWVLIRPSGEQRERLTMDPDKMDSSLTATTDGARTLRGGRLDRALARASGAPLRKGNKLALLKNGPNTYDDWLAAIARAQRWVHLDNY